MRKKSLITSLLISSIAFGGVSAKKYDLSSDPFNDLPQIWKGEKTECNVKLPELLMNGTKLLEKDRDSLNSIIKELNLFAMSDCPVQWRALAQAYEANYLLAKYRSDSRNINNRSALQGVVPVDMEEWSANIYFQKIIESVCSSLRPEEELSKLKISSFPDLIEEKSFQGDQTLYELLSENALAILNSLSLEQLRRYYPQTIPAQNILFLPLKEFLKYNIAENTTNVVTLQLQIHQSLLRQLLNSGNRVDLVKRDLERLQYGYELSVNSRNAYVDALRALLGEYADTPESLLIALPLMENTLFATNENNSEKRREIYEMANQLLLRFPHATGNCEIRNFIFGLQALQLNSSMPAYIMPGKEIPVSIRFKNSQRLHLTMKNQEGKEVWNKTLFSEREQNLISKDTTVQIPPQPYGKYELAIVDSKSPIDTAKMAVTVTSLFPVFQKLSDQTLQVLVLDFNTGKPQEGVDVFVYDNSSRKETKNKTQYITNKQGVAILKESPKIQTLAFYVQKGEDRYRGVAMSYNYARIPMKEQVSEINFFTDRSVYRPGQTVYFKGIAWEGTPEKSQALAGKAVKVTLYDANNQEVRSIEMQTDSFGAISGEFLLPKDRLEGAYRISSSLGSTSFEVASYKRPSFWVALQSPVGEYAFNDTIQVEGDVKTFSGVGLGDSQVEYSIYFNRNLWRWNPVNQKIASGSLKTNSSGQFTIPFVTSLPEGEVETNYGSYSVQVSVTNSAGETQTTSVTISVGKSSLFVSLNLPKTLNYGLSPLNNIPSVNVDSLHDVSVNVKSLAGVSLEMPGVLTLYKLPYLGADNFGKPVVKDTLREKIASYEFVSGASTGVNIERIPSGYYLLEAVVKDQKGRDSRVGERFIAYSLNDKKMPVETPNWFVTINNKCLPGEQATLLLGSSTKNVSVLSQLFDGSKLIESNRFTISDEVKKIHIPYRPEYGNQLTVNYLFVKEGKLYENKVRIEKITPSPKLTIRTDVFRDKILPGSREEWKFSVTDASGNPVEAQLMADLYDASLDKIKPHGWYFNPVYRPNFFTPVWRYDYQTESNGYLYWQDRKECPVSELPSLKYLNNDRTDYIGFGSSPKIRGFSKITSASAKTNDMRISSGGIIEDFGGWEMEEESIQPLASENGLDSIALRDNLSETAFFYPKLLTDKDGSVSISFTMPEALTEWKLMLLANTEGMYWGELKKKVVTAKPFMINPNLPRFLRQGDQAVLPVMIMNQTGRLQSGEASLSLYNPSDETQIYKEIKLPFTVQPGTNTTIEFHVTVPESIDLTVVRLKAGNEEFSDGEQQLLPILPSKTLVTQSMTMNLSGKGTKRFRYDSFLENKSKGAMNYRYTVEYTGNPAWYAVQALPVLNTDAPDNASSAINSFFVNTVAASIAASNPQIKKAIDAWKASDKGSETLLSNLEKNESLKQLLLAETPWVLQARNETENMQSLSRLFDSNRQENIRRQSIAVLEKLQNENGGFAWYPGMQPSLFQTIEILNQFGRLISMDAVEYNEKERMIQYEGIKYTDREIERSYNLKKKQKDAIPKSTDINWVCMRGAYRDIPFTGESLEAHKHYLDYLKMNWDKYDLYQQAILSVAMRAYGLSGVADEIAAYLKSLSSQSDENGIYWANNRTGYFQSASPLKTHVALMNALKEAGATESEMNGMKIWLLKQKQTQSWGNTETTADAIYGMLMGGNDWLSSSSLPIIKVGGIKIDPNPWFSYADSSYMGEAITPALGEIEIEQKENHPGYGAAYWQFFENFDSVRQSGKSLLIQKQLFKEIQTVGGTAIEPISGDLKPGDLVVTRLVVTADRDFGYVTLKDQRAACFQPVEQLSGMQFAQGVLFYQQTGDAVTTFYFNFLPKGTYVLEYKLKCDRSGAYQDGISSIQCLYAPEFVGNTQGDRILVK